MNEVIDILKELGNIPIVTIPFGAFIAYLFTMRKKKIRDEQVTKNVLSFINSEMHENLDIISNIYPYNKLSLTGLELINIQVGNIRINNDQLAKINKIYTLFDQINKKILSVREAHHSKNLSLTKKLAEELKELQKRCGDLTTKYLKEFFEDFKVLLSKRAQ